MAVVGTTKEKMALITDSEGDSKKIRRKGGISRDDIQEMHNGSF